MEHWAKRQQLAGGASRLSWNRSDGSGENNGWIKESGDHKKQLHGRDNALVRPRPANAVPNTQERGIGEANHAHARYHLLHHRRMVTADSYATTRASQTPPDETQTTAVSVGDTTGTAGETSVASLMGYSPEIVSSISRTLESSSRSAVPSSSPTLASVIQVPPTASKSGLVSLAVLPPGVTALSTTPSHIQSTTQSTHFSSSTGSLPSSSYEPNPSSDHTQTTHLLPASSSYPSPSSFSSPPPTITFNSSLLPSSGGSGNSSRFQM